MSKRKRGKAPIVDGELQASRIVTHKTITEIREDGSQVTKRVLVTLEKPRPMSVNEPFVPDMPDPHYDLDELVHPSTPAPPRKKHTQKHYIMEYVSRIDSLLGALLSREALNENYSRCRHCEAGDLAIWRCKDCALGTPMCRGCMRSSHQQNPFHRIEQWNGTFFQPTDLWQVGVYILIRHHEGEPICETLKLQMTFLEKAEIENDIAEQRQLASVHQTPTPASRTPTPAPAHTDNLDQEMDNISQHTDADGLQDNEFMDYLQRLRDEEYDFGEREDEEEEEEEEDVAPAPNQYLPTDTGIHAGDHAGAGTQTNHGHSFLSSYLRVVHTNGLHNIAMVSCPCRGQDNVPLDLVASKLLPASFQRIRTLFTVQVLDHFRLCNLELKASAYQFYHLLRRLTQPMAPGEVVDLYREFRRMSRIWRWMKRLKWAGYGAGDNTVDEVKSAELTMFCPACPQPGINLPADWLQDPARWVYKRIFVADGNFKADHVRQKNAAGDFWLSEGSGMIPKAEEYAEFLKYAIEQLTKAPCENKFRAIMNSLQSSKACDITGIVAIACARHGCYAPNSVVDLFKGEQQKNVDFAFLKALVTTHVKPEQGVLFIYDIVCQYIIYLLNRIGALLPTGLTIDAAIGLFHVHAHKDQCFFRYASSFIPGAGVVAGEILESLWSSLNAISPTARTATLAHRAEMLDDHATDSNHKKQLGMVTRLGSSLRTAVDMLDHARTYYQGLTDQSGQIAVEKWTQDVKDAERTRLDDISAMDIYAAKVKPAKNAGRPATRATSSALEQWMSLALTVEEKQLEIVAKVRLLGQNAGSGDRRSVEKDRDALAALMLQLSQAQRLAGIAETIGPTTDHDESLHVWDNPFEPALEDTADSVPAPASSSASSSTDAPPLPIEKQIIPLPSNSNVDQLHSPLELHHRITLADHHLSRIRELIAEKSFQYSHVIRRSPRKGVTTRSRAAVKKLNVEIALQSRLYARCRARLVRLGADEDTQARLLVLSPDDVKASTAIVNPNEPGSTRVRLSWIWRAAGGHRFGLAGGAGAGAGSDTNTSVEDAASTLEFRRVHWLRARAQFLRWQEEVTLLGYEMQWTVRFFIHKSRLWAAAVDAAGSPNAGALAYARRKHAMWQGLAVNADRTFSHLNNAYKSPM